RGARVSPRRAERTPAARGAGTTARTTSPLLAVDVGNTETVIGRFVGAELEESWRLTSGRSTTDELRLALASLLKNGAAGGPAVLGSVVRALTQPWLDALRAVTGRGPLEVTAASSPIPLQVTEPDTVGPDRIANALAGRALHGAPCIVVDLGTATTFDCVSR